jgi:hypothetical protein
MAATAKKVASAIVNRAMAKDKGKAKESSARTSSVSSRASSAVATCARRTLAKLKEDSKKKVPTSNLKRKGKVDVKGKGKAKAVSTDDDESGSDFKVDSDDAMGTESEAEFTQEDKKADDDEDSDDLTDIDDIVKDLENEGNPEAGKRQYME